MLMSSMSMVTESPCLLNNAIEALDAINASIQVMNLLFRHLLVLDALKTSKIEFQTGSDGDSQLRKLQPTGVAGVSIRFRSRPRLPRISEQPGIWDPDKKETKIVLGTVHVCFICSNGSRESKAY